MHTDKFVIISSIFCMSLLFTSCDSAKQEMQTSTITTSPETEIALSQSLDNFQEITIPSTLLGDEISVISENSKLIHENDDGTLTYQIDSISLKSIKENIVTSTTQSIQAILDDDTNYPDITSIMYNKDLSEFTIFLSSSDINIYESMLVMSFYTVGNKYQIYNGTNYSDVLTTVIYLNSETGEEVSHSDSNSIE